MDKLNYDEYNHLQALAAVKIAKLVIDEIPYVSDAKKIAVAAIDNLLADIRIQTEGYYQNKRRQRHAEGGRGYP